MVGTPFLGHLPEMTPTDILTSAIEDLYESIRGFPDNFCDSHQARGRPAQEEEFERLAGRLDPGGWQRDIADPKTQEEAMQAFIGHTLFRSIDPAGEGETSLLPPEMHRCYQGMSDKKSSE